jgi:hypothetical protein
MELLVLEKKLSDLKASHHRQLALAGNPWYDPILTYYLKKDIEWLEQKKKELADPEPTVFWPEISFI